MAEPGSTILITDHPWPDVELERSLIEGAGLTMVAGGHGAGTEDETTALIETVGPSAILTCWAPVSERAIMAPARLAIVGRIGVGLDNIDVAAATRRGAWVTNVPDYCIGEVSDHALALTLSVLRGIVAGDRETKTSGWHIPQFSSPRLSELTVAVVGYGRIGRETARKFRALGCRLLINDPFVAEVVEGEQIADMARVQNEADVIVLHAPLTKSTHAMIDGPFLDQCLKKPLIVNVSRGGLVDNAALEAALDAGIIRCAALDVVDGEPAPPFSLLSHPGTIITPHVAYRSDASIIELRRRACEEAIRVLAGKPPRNPCNRPGVTA